MSTLIWLVGSAVIICISLFLNSRSEKKIRNWTIGGIALALWTLISSVTIVGAGETKLPKTFGIVSGKPIPENTITFLPPWQSTETFSSRLSYIKVTSGNDATFISKEGVNLTTAIEFPFRLEPTHVDLVYEKLGGEQKAEETFRSAALVALRDASTSLAWKDSSIDKREDFRKAIHVSLVHVMNLKLESLGIPAELADHIFEYPLPNVMQCVPPDRILQENGEAQAALIRLQRQETLISIEKKLADQRGEAGKGIKLMMDGAGIKDYTAADAERIIYAEAALNNSNTFSRAGEAGKIGQIMYSTQAVPVTMPTK